MGRIVKPVAATAALLLAVACSPERSYPTNDVLDDRVRHFVEAFSANRDFSGVVAVSRSGEPVVEQAFGFADFASQKRFEKDTSFHIASVSKTFTAAAIRELADEGTLDLDDSLGKFVPDFPYADQISIRQLLNHQSGVADYWSADDVLEIASRQIDLDELVTWLGGRPLAYEPGTDSQYSNSGYALLAAAIERASGQEYHAYLAERIYPRANLTATSAFESNTVAVGYQPSHDALGIEPPTPYNPSLLTGSGSLKSTAPDLLRWCDSFVADFNNPETGSFLYGWGAREGGGHRWVEQSGRNPGFSAHVRGYPDDEMCLVVLSNIESESVGAIGAGIAEIAFGGAPEAPALRPAPILSQEQQMPFVGTFEIEPGNNVRVRSHEGKLELRGQNGVFLPLEPIAEDRFFFRQLYVEIGTKREADGSVVALLWGGSYPMARIDD